jgi:hypothetical protein
MGKESIEQVIARVAALADAPGSSEPAAALREALTHKSNLVAAKAAVVVARRGLAELSDCLADTYRQFSGKKPDKGCLALTAIAKTLYELGAPADAVFLHGVEHVQKEASWGPPVDVAAELRGVCALGLVRMGHREALARAADLLGDAEVQARILGARALAYSAHDYAALPLRTKIRIGDSDPEVMSECFAALLKLTPQHGVPLVARYLDCSDEDLAQAAALALGASRLSAAGETLMNRWKSDIHPDNRRRLALPVATLRSPVSLQFLLDALAEEPASTCETILEALRIYAADTTVVQRIEGAIRAKGNLAVSNAFDEKFK